MLKELVSNLIEENMCLVDIVGKYYQVTKQLEDYVVSIDDKAVYLLDGDDRYVINFSYESMDKDDDADCVSYHLNYIDASEIYIAFPLLENI